MSAVVTGLAVRCDHALCADVREELERILGRHRHDDPGEAVPHAKLGAYAFLEGLLQGHVAGLAKGGTIAGLSRARLESAPCAMRTIRRVSWRVE